MVMQGKRGFVAGPAEGRAFNVLGHSIKAKVYGSDANGDYYAFEAITPAGLGIPPHVHQHEDEVIWVVEGEAAAIFGKYNIDILPPPQG